MQKSKQYLK